MAIHLVPAYGRQYLTRTAAETAWLNGKDFKIHNGPYCSIRNIDGMIEQFETVEIHWAYPTDIHEKFIAPRR